MADLKTEQEPSIEEILESIRQIISEDGTTPATGDGLTLSAPEPEAPIPAYTPPPPPPAAPTPKPVTLTTAQDDIDDILNLTERVTPEPAYTMPSAQQEDDIDMGGNMDSGILSEVTTDAAVAAMARLLTNNVAVEREVPGRVGNVTLEDMARDLMRPLIKTWLDQNLPRVVEKMVAKEMERVSRMAMRQ